MEKKESPGGIGSQAAKPGPQSAPGTVANKPSPGVHAKLSVPAFGGNRGGKARQDGLVPGSAAALEADRKKDAERKRAVREAKKLADPVPLPSAPPPPIGPIQTPVNGASALPGSPDPVQSVAVPWEPDTIKPLLELLIEETEQSRINSRKSRCATIGLPERVTKEVVILAAYPAKAKQALVLSGANGTTKILNAVGISGKYSDAAIAVTALLAIVISNRKSDEKFEELIEEFKLSQEPAKPGAAKT